MADPVVHVDQLPWVESSHGDRFASRRRQIGAAAGARRIGCSEYEVPAGRSAFPRHLHHVNEEALLVLEGSAILRLDDAEHEVRTGDYVALLTGVAHQLVAGPDGVRYLVFSTMESPDVTEYPYSDKFGVFVGGAPGSREPRTFAGFFPRSARRDYWDGE